MIYDRSWRVLAIKVVSAFVRMANRAWSMCGETPLTPGQLTLRLLRRSLFGLKGHWLILEQMDQLMTTQSGGEHAGHEIGKSCADAILEAELALLAASPLVIGSTPLGEINAPNARPMWIRFEEGGAIHNRMYRSGRSWRVRVTGALAARQPVRVLEFDEWGRLKSLFPTEVCARLKWNAAHTGDIAPVARFFHPKGHAEMLLLRSRCDGHAVDVIHNLSDSGSVQQSVWIVDILRLNPLLGIKLTRDDDFHSGMRLSDHVRFLQGSDAHQFPAASFRSTP